MWDSSDADTHIRSENEISASEIERYYDMEEHIFNEALDAVIAGCVTKYSFYKAKKRFVGNVTSFDGLLSYGVKILVTDDFTIKSALCECAKDICHHIGALALNSGFQTPIFSCLPHAIEFATTTDSHRTLDRQIEKSETDIEFIGVKVEEAVNKDCFDENNTTNECKTFGPSEQMFVHGDNKGEKSYYKSRKIDCDKTEGYSDPISKEKRTVDPNDLKKKVHRRKSNRGKRTRIGFSRKKNDWKKEPSPLIITPAEWLKLYDSENNKLYMNSMYVLKDQLSAQFKNISCKLRLYGKYSTMNGETLRMKCSGKQCRRIYSLFVKRNHNGNENKEFEVSYTGAVNHKDFDDK